MVGHRATEHFYRNLQTRTITITLMRHLDNYYTGCRRFTYRQLVYGGARLRYIYVQTTGVKWNSFNVGRRVNGGTYNCLQRCIVVALQLFETKCAMFLHCNRSGKLDLQPSLTGQSRADERWRAQVRKGRALVALHRLQIS